ncbi:MAG: hypothetical protein JRI23_23445, partial [Deltaproteobacteria bacterium]|nr:hypothetical protein [Deltaproteobacteria bacterium]MBW2534934.1 hypothetical protein [Deltaproteobacteria bacterium]
ALAGFASAVVLALFALMMAGESVHRFLEPVPIAFNEAISVAILGYRTVARLLRQQPISTS